MALYKLNESYSTPPSAEILLEQFESFVLYEDMQVEERSLDSLNKQQKEQQEQLERYDKEISSKEAELKKLINEKPKSWLERKLESFQAAIERFEVKHKLTKDNKSKGIIKKILSVLTRIVKWINEKLLQGTRWVGNKFFKREEKLKAHEKKVSAMDLDLRHIKANRGLKANSLDSTKSMIEKAKKNGKGKTNDYTFTGKETKEEFDKMMTDKNWRIVFR
jgi:hypothetical protein